MNPTHTLAALLVTVAYIAVRWWLRRQREIAAAMARHPSSRVRLALVVDEDRARAGNERAGGVL